MSTLELTVPAGWEGYNLPQQQSYTLSRSRFDNSESNNERLVVNGSERLHSRSAKSWLLLRGTLERAGRSPEAVFCKFVVGHAALTRRLRHEVDIYNHLLALQGNIVPMCYGLYEGTFDWDGDEEECACLVLEHCDHGDLPSLPDADWDLRVAVVKAHRDIHNVHVLHTQSASEDNVLVRPDGRVVIINFSTAQASHDCKGQPIIPHNREPWRGNYGCKELHCLASLLDIWMPNYINCFGDSFSLNNKEIPEDLARCAPPGTSEEEAMEKAQKAWDQYNAEHDWMIEHYPCGAI